jgi:hypothetical protein
VPNIIPIITATNTINEYNMYIGMAIHKNTKNAVIENTNDTIKLITIDNILTISITILSYKIT